MRNVASIQLRGNIVKRETRQAGSLSILALTVAGDALSSDGSRKIPFYQVVDVLGNYADAMGSVLKVGAPVTVLGTLSQRSWETADGQKRSAISITADSIVALEGQFEAITDSKGQARMSEGQNRVGLLGNLTRDPELRYTPNGHAVTRLSIAVNSKRGEKEEVSFFDLTAWREVAEEAAKLTKGTPILVEGAITNESWTANDDTKRYATRFEAFTLNAVRRPAGAGATDDPRETAPNPQDLAPQQPPVEEFPPEADLPF